jgi:hypothetical protein
MSAIRRKGDHVYHAIVATYVESRLPLAPVERNAHALDNISLSILCIASTIVWRLQCATQ